MNEKEKKAIIYFDDILTNECDIEFWKRIKKLIEEQQKEIEELNTELEIRIKWQQYFEKEYINKDKIREKIKELKNIIEFERPSYKETLEYTIDILQELLEEN